MLDFQSIDSNYFGIKMINCLYRTKYFGLKIKCC